MEIPALHPNKDLSPLQVDGTFGIPALHQPTRTHKNLQELLRKLQFLKRSGSRPVNGNTRTIGTRNKEQKKATKITVFTVYKKRGELRNNNNTFYYDLGEDVKAGGGS